MNIYIAKQTFFDIQAPPGGVGGGGRYLTHVWYRGSAEGLISWSCLGQKYARNKERTNNGLNLHVARGRS